MNKAKGKKQQVNTQKVKNNANEIKIDNDSIRSDTMTNQYGGGNVVGQKKQTKKVLKQPKLVDFINQESKMKQNKINLRQRDARQIKYQNDDSMMDNSMYSRHSQYNPQTNRKDKKSQKKSQKKSISKSKGKSLSKNVKVSESKQKGIQKPKDKAQNKEVFNPKNVKKQIINHPKMQIEEPIRMNKHFKNQQKTKNQREENSKNQKNSNNSNSNLLKTQSNSSTLGLKKANQKNSGLEKQKDIKVQKNNPYQVKKQKEDGIEKDKADKKRTKPITSNKEKLQNINKKQKQTRHKKGNKNSQELLIQSSSSVANSHGSSINSKTQKPQAPNPIAQQLKNKTKKQSIKLENKLNTKNQQKMNQNQKMELEYEESLSIPQKNNSKIIRQQSSKRQTKVNKFSNVKNQLQIIYQKLTKELPLSYSTKLGDLIPQFSKQRLIRIQRQISQLGSSAFHRQDAQLSPSELEAEQKCIQMTITLMSWIWQIQSRSDAAQIHLEQIFDGQGWYEKQSASKQDKTNLSRFINKLIQIYNKLNKGSFFHNKLISLQRDIFNRNGLGQLFNLRKVLLTTKSDAKDHEQLNSQKNPIKANKSNKKSFNSHISKQAMLNQIIQNGEIQQAQVSSIKQHSIFNLYKNYINYLKSQQMLINSQQQSIPLKQTKVPLIIFLIQILIFNYDSIDGDLHQIYVWNIFKDYQKNIKTSIELSQNKGLVERLHYEAIQKQIICLFTQLNYLKNQKTVIGYYLKKKTRNEVFLFMYIKQLVKMFQSQIKKQETFDSLSPHLIKSAYCLLEEFTYFMRRFKGKFGSQLNIIELEKSFQFIITNLSDYYIYYQIKKQKLLKTKEKFSNQNLISEQIQIDKQLNQIVDVKLKLLLFDWSILKMKSQQNKTFEGFVKKSKKWFYNHLKNSNYNNLRDMNSQEKMKKNFQRYTIQELEEEEFQQMESYNKDQRLNENLDNIFYEDAFYHRNNYYEQEYKKKSFVWILHLNFLAFQETKPQSHKNRQKILKQQKSKVLFNISPVQLNDRTFCSLNRYQLFLLVLENKDYIIQLLEQIQCIETQQLSRNQILKNVGNGLIKLCKQLHKFKNLSTINTILRQIQANPSHKKMLDEVFNQDIGHQRRLSQSKIFTTKGLQRNTNAIQVQQPVNALKNNQQLSSNWSQDQQKARQVLIKSCQQAFFLLIRLIQQKIAFLPLTSYIQSLMSDPGIFQSQVFFKKLLQVQPINECRQFLSRLITDYVDQSLRMFTLQSYYHLFIETCLQKFKQKQIGLMILKLPIQKLLRFHLDLLKQSFEQKSSQIKKIIPQSLNKDQQFNILTSGGFQDKVMVIDKLFKIPQLILNRGYLEILSSAIGNGSKFLDTKIIFTIISDKFGFGSGITRETGISRKQVEEINILVNSLQKAIETNSIDQACGVFHFIQLLFFNFHKMFDKSKLMQKNNVEAGKKTKNSKNLKNVNPNQSTKADQHPFQCSYQQQYTTFICQILDIISKHHKSIIKMYEKKQSIILRLMFQQKQIFNSNEQTQFGQRISERQNMDKHLKKSNLMHKYFIRNIIRFLENIKYTEHLLKNIKFADQLIVNFKQICKCKHYTKQEAYNYSIKEFSIPNTIYHLSLVAGRQIFQEQFSKKFNDLEQNPRGLFDKYQFLVSLRFIANQWINLNLQCNNQPPIQSKKNFQIFNKPNTSKSNRMTQQGNQTHRFNKNVTQSKSKVPDSIKNIQRLISVDKIIQICLRILRLPLKDCQLLRTSQKLKQKLICLQILTLLHHYFVENQLKIKSIYPQLLKKYKQRYLPVFSHTLVLFVMNEDALLLPDERQKEIMFLIRMNSIKLLVQNFSSVQNDKYNQYQWKMVNKRQVFWFTIYSLALDQSVQIRYFLVNICLSRFKDDITKKFRTNYVEIVTLFELIAANEQNKIISQQVKTALLAQRNYPNQIGFINNTLHPIHEAFLSSILNIVWFLANFHTMYNLQKGIRKINDNLIYMMVIDMIFDHREMQTYLYRILNYFQQLSSQKNLDKYFNHVKWLYPFNMYYYIIRMNLTSDDLRKKQQYEILKRQIEIEEQKQKQINKKSKNAINSLDYHPKMYKLNELEKIYSKMYPNSSQVFVDNLKLTMKALNEEFKARASLKSRFYSKVPKKHFQLDFAKYGLKSGIFTPFAASAPYENANQENITGKGDISPNDQLYFNEDDEIQI